MRLFILFILLVLVVVSCRSYFKVKRSKNIEYHQKDSKKTLSLNVFTQRKSKKPKEVLVFIHGGNWDSGNKSLYSFFGNRMAAKGFVVVIISYTLSPEANYDQMAFESAKSVKWVKDNIKNYGGNPDKIFVSGHSAGGGLAALISVNNKYFDSLKISNPIKGCILIDAAGLDMYNYLKESNFPVDHTYMKTFTRDPKNWKDASPVFHLHDGIPPFLIYMGGETYPSITKSNNTFLQALKKYQPSAEIHLQENKKHIPMITQYLFVKNPRYKEIADFMRR